jgi:hypothetical protein
MTYLIVDGPISGSKLQCKCAVGHFSELAVSSFALFLLSSESSSFVAKLLDETPNEKGGTDLYCGRITVIRASSPSARLSPVQDLQDKQYKRLTNKNETKRDGYAIPIFGVVSRTLRRAIGNAKTGAPK